MKENKTVERNKFTTTLSRECLDGLNDLSSIMKVRKYNIIIEKLVEQEMERYEMDKKRNS